MKCIHCGHKKTEVTNSRIGKGGIEKWRRRKCLSCKRVFTTTESVFADNLFVIKSNKKRQRFIYEKLFASVFSVLNTRKSHDNGSDSMVAKKVTQKVIKNIFSLPNFSKDISTENLILLVHKELALLDRSYAEHYIYYSKFRRDVGKKGG